MQIDVCSSLYGPVGRFPITMAKPVSMQDILKADIATVVPLFGSI